jgi:hypothetical protein
MKSNKIPVTAAISYLRGGKRQVLYFIFPLRFYFGCRRSLLAYRNSDFLTAYPLFGQNPLPE